MMNRQTSSVCALLALTMAILAAEPARAARHCAAQSLDEDAIKPSMRLAIRPFTFTSSMPYKPKVGEKWAVELPALLSKELQRKGFKDITILENDTEGLYDLIVTGKFVKLDPGNAAGRMMVGTTDSNASMTVQIKFVDPASDKTVAEFLCQRSAMGGPIGLGGLLAGSSKVIMHNHMERFAKSTAKIIAEASSTKARKTTTTAGN